MFEIYKKIAIYSLLISLIFALLNINFVCCIAYSLFVYSLFFYGMHVLVEYIKGENEYDFLPL